ncbi:MAG: HDOD domain-containing protein [Phycisphaerae bacterium]|nr:HDOD domain-containing protein [Phycisphaerae bacterium]
MSTTLWHPVVDPNERLQQLLGKISEASTLPAVFTKIMEVINDPNASASDLTAVVKCDPSLTTRVLRAINSAYYGLSTPTSNLKYAVALLGFRTIRNLAMTVLVGGLFKQDLTVLNYSRLGLWKHIISVALTARLIARHTAGSTFDEDAYLGGLLHDVGIVLMDHHDHEVFCHTIKQTQPNRELRVCERELIGFDHAELAAAVATNWRFPSDLVECFRWHHEAYQASAPARPLTSAVELANFLCNHKGINSVGIRYEPRLRTALLADLRIAPDDLRSLWQQMDKELSSARDLFGV